MNPRRHLFSITRERSRRIQLHSRSFPRATRLRSISCILGSTAAQLAFLLLSLVACASTPKPIAGAVDLPSSFDTVWLRADELHPAVVIYMPMDGPFLLPTRGVMSDTGRLTVAENHLEYEGRLYSIRIPYSDITDLSYGTRRGDFINRWITVRYEAEGQHGEVAFSAGKALGWAGGSAEIYSLVEYGLRRYREKGPESIQESDGRRRLLRQGSGKQRFEVAPHASQEELRGTFHWSFVG